jgi:hypothetical protein
MSSAKKQIDGVTLEEVPPEDTPHRPVHGISKKKRQEEKR